MHDNNRPTCLKLQNHSNIKRKIETVTLSPIINGLELPRLSEGWSQELIWVSKESERESEKAVKVRYEKELRKRVVGGHLRSAL